MREMDFLYWTSSLAMREMKNVMERAVISPEQSRKPGYFRGKINRKIPSTIVFTKVKLLFMK
jgi:hypothetical protein